MRDRERVKDSFAFVGSVAVTLKAKKILKLARTPGLTITSDSKIELASVPSSNQVWPTASGVRPSVGQPIGFEPADDRNRRLRHRQEPPGFNSGGRRSCSGRS